MDSENADVTERILACAFHVHARLGAGLLESTYRACLHHRMRSEGLCVEAEVPIDIVFDGVAIAGAYRADLIVNEQILLELKAVERLLPIHISQTLTYIKHAALPTGLLLNFNVQHLRHGIRRVDNRALRTEHSPASPASFLPAFDYLP
jgi:GxxExxY protein